MLLHCFDIYWNKVVVKSQCDLVVDTVTKYDTLIIARRDTKLW